MTWLQKFTSVIWQFTEIKNDFLIKWNEKWFIQTSYLMTYPLKDPKNEQEKEREEEE